jgi:hypothetical protein
MKAQSSWLIREQKAENRRQRAENRRQRAENRRQRTDEHPISDIYFMTSDI